MPVRTGGAGSRGSPFPRWSRDLPNILLGVDDVDAIDETRAEEGRGAVYGLSGGESQTGIGSRVNGGGKLVLLVLAFTLLSGEVGEPSGGKVVMGGNSGAPPTPGARYAKGDSARPKDMLDSSKLARPGPEPDVPGLPLRLYVAESGNDENDVAGPDDDVLLLSSSKRRGGGRS
jgi:hypothetical protein